MIEESQPGRIIFLDWLRIIACLSVLIGHKFYSGLDGFIYNLSVPEILKSILKLILPLFIQGGAGVVIFFLVSGYIITHVLAKESSFSFVIKRLFRIYPLYIFAVFMQSSLDNNAWHSESIQTLIKQISLFGDLFNVPPALGGVSWTLRVEILFYIIMACVRYFEFYKPLNKIWLASTAVVFLLLLILMPPFPGYDGWRHGYYNQFAPFLFLGLTYCLYDMRKVPKWYLVVYTIATLTACLLFIPLYKSNHVNPCFMIYGYGCFLLMYLIRKFLIVTCWVSLLAEITYSVYLFHMWLFDKFTSLVTLYVSEFRSQHIIATLMLFIFCGLTTYFFEKPMIKIGAILAENLQPLGWKDL